MLKRNTLGKYWTPLVNVILWSISIIFFCAGLLKITGSLLYNYQKVTPTFWDSLYFSIVSFTTLGYGDYHAVGFMRFVVGLESFAGVILMALFGLIMAKKILAE